jgi:hypothetical protein
MSEFYTTTAWLIGAMFVIMGVDVVVMWILHRRDDNETYKSIKDNKNNE